MERLLSTVEGLYIEQKKWLFDGERNIYRVRYAYTKWVLLACLSKLLNGPSTIGNSIGSLNY